MATRKKKIKDDAPKITVQHIPLRVKRKRKLKTHAIYNHLAHFEFNGLVMPIKVQVICFSKLLGRENSIAMISLGETTTKATMEKEAKARRKSREVKE